MTKRIVVISDVQMPYEDRKALKAVINFVGEYQPDEVVQIGDLMDYPQPSRWSKGTAAEYEGSVFADSDYGKRHFLEPLRAVYDGPVGVVEGNHDLRPRTYLSKYAPALAESGAFNLETLLDFDAFGVTKLPDWYEFAKGWVITHGHLGKIRLSPVAGNTALNAAKKMGASLIMGHTHRLGTLHHTLGYNGEVKQTLTGVEVGHLMNQKLASYLDTATANWQAGFAIVHRDGNYVHAETIPIEHRRFTVEGAVFTI
ncbi:metallophosphoesterase [Amycolatopsis cihanbeyliensis]|uniref:Calcineurin-like phosphoesterase family protein n=1 Tax=Amycolatopsis cihanbeyliensis TaxID=1128664 RepID=A0A542DNJ4_AMYCI|nr:metallophosphoesterase [Amycolatopsis cihanbeyliensis]TQJ04660.1 calcineurin-like phosphoesterase family protein [Amycolatopsis cihanbeyliensis]